MLIYRARGPALVDHGAAYRAALLVSRFVYICMSIQLHSVGRTVAVYFPYYTFRMSLCLIDYHYTIWFSSRDQIGLILSGYSSYSDQSLESCLTHWGRYTDINDLTTVEENKKSWVARERGVSNSEARKDQSLEQSLSGTLEPVSHCTLIVSLVIPAIDYSMIRCIYYVVH